MPVINRIAAYAKDMTQWRQSLHRQPELQFECHKTAAFVVERLRDFGISEIHERIATTGIVAIIDGSEPGPTIGLRADMDALPLDEVTGADYASQIPGMMHACGHDGHTTMLLGAARYLAETRNFSGKVALIFQPAEEGGGGGEVMVQEGIMDRFDIKQVFALHNFPDAEEGAFSVCPGPAMAAADTFTIKITGQGGHGAHPESTKDPIAAAVAIAQAIGTIVSRNADGLDDLVISVTQIHSGTADNIIPETAMLGGTVRTFSKDMQSMVVDRLKAIVDGHALAFDVRADLDFEFGYPPTVNDGDMAEFAARVAREIAGADKVDDNAPRRSGAEDFSYLLNARPGAYIFLGQGKGPGLHNPAYDFNDNIAPIGASYFARLVESAQPLKGSGHGE